MYQLQPSFSNLIPSLPPNQFKDLFGLAITHLSPLGMNLVRFVTAIRVNFAISGAILI
jgi:hypothetical protein